jgi:DNA-binding transcriptional MerR regulator
MKKIYYSIGDVGKIVNEEPHVLRYWESEFGKLRPKKNKSGNRVYTEHDLQVISAISKLLRNDKLTLKQAKEAIRDVDISQVIVPGITEPEKPPVKQNGRAGGTQATIFADDAAKQKKELIELLKEIRTFLQS